MGVVVFSVVHPTEDKNMISLSVRCLYVVSTLSEFEFKYETLYFLKISDRK